LLKRLIQDPQVHGLLFNKEPGKRRADGVVHDASRRLMALFKAAAGMEKLADEEDDAYHDRMWERAHGANRPAIFSAANGEEKQEYLSRFGAMYEVSCCGCHTSLLC
jgi:hypothetical protein